MDSHDQHLSLLVATDAALLMILALLAKKKLEWKRPAPQAISRRRRRSGELETVPRWMKVVLVIGVCLAGAVAGSAGALGAVASPVLIAYLAATILVLL